MNATAATRRYAQLVFLTWLPVGLLIAPMVLLMVERGLDIATIAAIGLVYSVTIAILELPTGGLADVWGRRRVLIASAVASLLGLLAFGFATTAAGFAIAAVLRGISRALGSGPPEAWFVDTLHEADGPDADLVPGIAHGQVSAGVALALGTVIGGLVPVAIGRSVGPIPALAVPVLAAAAVEVIRIAVTALGLPEPDHPRHRVDDVLRSIPMTVRRGVRLGATDAVLTRILLASAGIGVALAAIELLTPPWLATATATPEGASLVYAVVAALGFAADAVGSSSSARLVAWTSSAARAAAAALMVAVLALVALAVCATGSSTAAVIGAAGAYCLLFIAFGATTAPQADLLHRRVSSDERATVLSVQSLLFQLVGAAGALGLGVLADRQGAGSAFAAAAVAVAAAATCFVRMPSTSRAQAGARCPPSSLR